MDLKVLVTGTGRCGTNFMANLLTTIGLPCGHEAVFTPDGWERASEILAGRLRPENSDISRDGTILSEGMNLVGDSSYAAAPFLDKVDTAVIHLIRDPIKVVASLAGSGFRNFAEAFPVNYADIPDHFEHEKFLYDHLPELREEMPQIDRACLFYLRWNEMIESSGKVTLLHKIEDPPDRIKSLFGFDGPCYENSSCNSFSHSSRAWSLSDISSPSILRGVREFMRKHGYAT